MHRLAALLRSLGPAGALANARRATEAADREDWLVQGLTHRLDQRQAARAQPAAARKEPTAA